MKPYRWVLCATAGVVCLAIGAVAADAQSPAVSAPDWRIGVTDFATARPMPVVYPSPGPSRRPSPSPSSTPRAKTRTVASGLTTLPSSTSQVIVVHAPTANTTHATLETFAKVHGEWVREFRAMAARIGKDGFSTHHVEGTPNTPVGVFGFGSTVYGLNANPGVKYAYHRLGTDDWWDENSNSSTYNTFQHSATSPGGPSEALWEHTVAYEYFAFITYNVPAVAGRGSGVFLHVDVSTATAGCVSLGTSNLIRVLDWLDPAKNPRVVISPDGDLHRF